MNIIECEENQLMEEFRNQVKDLQRSDGTLRRFLKARNYNLHNAEDMLRKSIKWRTEHDIDNALKWKIHEQVFNKFPLEYPGVDYQNRAVIYAALGNWPMRELIDAGHKDEMLRNFYVGIERTVYEICKSGEQGLFIVDLAACSYWKYAHYEILQHLMDTFRVYEANYPERLGEVYIINAPFFFNYFWSFLKPLLNGNTLSKVMVFGSDEEKYMAALVEKIPASSMPISLRKSLKETK